MPRHRFSSTLTLTLALAAALGLSSASALAANLNPGSTTDPLPAANLPAGSVLERTIAKDFDISIPAFPIARHCVGTVTQYVYRLPDNTITFRYVVANDRDSIGAPTDLYVRDFSEWTTDVSYAGGIGFTTWPDRAVRAFDGSSVRFEWDLGVASGNTSRAATVRTDATAYIAPGRYVPVASRLTIASGSNTDLIYGFAYPVTDSSPPIVSLTGPASLACVCSPAAITGTAHDPNGFDQYELEYAANANGPWNSIVTSSTPHSSAATLGSWNTSSPVNVPQGYYFLRLTATNSSGMASSVTNIVFVDKQFDTVELRSPGAGQILGGSVCFDGTVQDGNSGACFSRYLIQYAPLPAGAPFTPVDPAAPTYGTPITNDGLGSWSTSSGPTAVADGPYRLRVTGYDDCGHTRTVTRDVVIDNTAPISIITSPIACGNVSGQVTITGTASDAHLAAWALQYTGGGAAGWVTISQGTSNVNNGVLGVWNTSGLPSCAYTLRLIVSDSAGISCSGNTNRTDHHVSVNAGCLADFNHTGNVSVQDIFDFISIYLAGCP